MRCLVLSDLHVEQVPFEVPEGDFDVVILAGDIHNGLASLDWARRAFERHPVVQVAGNHEYYDEEHDTCRAEMRARARSLGIHWLDNDAVVLGDVEFLGCTLWTDFRVYESPGRAQNLSAGQAMQANRALIQDFRLIRSGERSFEPADAQRLHEQSRQWLESALSHARRRPRVVVSHHLPSWQSVCARFADSVTNAAFVSNCDDLVRHADLWVHGHTHSSCRYRLGDAQVVCNPRGYPRRGRDGGFENPDFDPGLVVEI